MEMLVLGLFCAVLLLSILLDIPVVAALLAGLVIFLLYARKTGYGWRTLLRICLTGVAGARTILITFVMIGMLTASWRAAGTIPSIVCYGASFIRPSVFLLMAFLLNSLVSALTGTSFGTSATMGVICATIGRALGIPMFMTGGAVLAGAFFGDRCSPLSTSALLVAEQTGTSIFDNIRNMLRTAFIPFLASCGIYLLLGMHSTGGASTPDLQSLFSAEFRLGLLPLLPAAIVFGLSLLRVNVKKAMPISILTASLISIFLQQMQAPALAASLIFGYRSQHPELAAMVNGGGVVSMLRPIVIISISTCYAGIFRATGLMDPLRKHIRHLAERTSRYVATLASCTLVSSISCNQTLAIMLGAQLCRELYVTDNADAADVSPAAPATDGRSGVSALALDLEDSAVLVAALIPWSIAGALPLATIGAPTSSILLAVYLYLVPAWRILTSLFSKRTRG